MGNATREQVYELVSNCEKVTDKMVAFLSTANYVGNVVPVPDPKPTRAGRTGGRPARW